MQNINKGLIIIITAIIILAGGIYFYFQSGDKNIIENVQAKEVLSNFVTEANESIPNLEEEIAGIQISEQEEKIFYDILEEQFKKVGIQITKDNLKSCCEDLLVKSLKILKLQEEAKIDARDIGRKSDLNIVMTLMEMYYASEGYYFQSKLMPKEIGIDSIPTDHVTNNPYNWLDNTVGSKTGCNSEQYCAWADLENGSYYVVSDQGSALVFTKPTECPCSGSSERNYNTSSNSPSVQTNTAILKDTPDWEKIYPGSGSTWAFILNPIFQESGTYPTTTSTDTDKQYFVKKCTDIYGLNGGAPAACYSFIALKTEDVNICDNVEEYFFGRCIFNIAKVKNDPSLCVKIPASTNGKNVSMTLDGCNQWFVEN